MRVQGPLLTILFVIGIAGCTGAVEQKPASPSSIPTHVALADDISTPTPNAPTPLAAPTTTLTALQQQQLAAIRAIIPDYNGAEDVCQQKEFVRQAVNCDDKGRVIALDLSQMDLTGVPMAVAQLSSLRSLDLSVNQISSLPREIGQLSDLRILWVSRDNLTSIPDEIFQLSLLENLDFSYNQLTSLPPDISKLSRLKRLALTDNKLEALPSGIGSLANLERLELAQNSLGVQSQNVMVQLANTSGENEYGTDTTWQRPND